jgi:sugar phosphate isomerase/epimerase
MDIYWVVTAGADPVAYLNKYKGRFKLGHIKDRMKNTKEKDASCILGEGSIDYPSILKQARANGMEYFIVEQERYDNTTQLDSAKADAKYMSMLSI